MCMSMKVYENVCVCVGAYVHVGVHIFQEKTQSGTRTFHDVRLKKPLTFHIG